MENNSEKSHDLAIRITDTSETVFVDEQFTLESREERTIDHVLPAPSGDQVTYIVEAKIETGQEVTEQFTVQIPADLHLLSVFVTSDDQVAIDRVVH